MWLGIDELEWIRLWGWGSVVWVSSFIEWLDVERLGVRVVFFDLRLEFL